MIRLANDVNGFFDANNTNMGILSHSEYPVQNADYIGRWTTVRYKSEELNIPTFISYTDGKEKVIKRNGKFYYDTTGGGEVPEFDRNGNPITITEVIVDNSVNNRYVIDRRYYPNREIKNSGRTTFFQILRYDLDKPYKVILRNQMGEVLVMSADEFKDIYDLPMSDMYTRILHLTNSQNLRYISPNTTNNEELFFTKYNNEKIHIAPLQNKEILGVEIYTEYDKDIFDSDLTFEDNKMSKYTYKDVNLDPVHLDTNKGFVYLDNMNDIVPPENYPITDQYNNRYNFTPRMRENLLMGDSLLRGQPDSTLQSFDNTYNVHLKSFIDTPRRAINKGIIIRADITNSDTPYLVALEYTDNGLRFICSDEARFFFDSANLHHLKNRADITDIINSNNIVK